MKNQKTTPIKSPSRKGMIIAIATVCAVLIVVGATVMIVSRDHIHIPEPSPGAACSGRRPATATGNRPTWAAPAPASSAEDDDDGAWIVLAVADIGEH